MAPSCPSDDEVLNVQMKRRQFFKSLGCWFVGLASLPFLSGLKRHTVYKPQLDPNEKIPVILIKTHDEGEFWCEANYGSFDAFVKNYRAKNRKRLRVAGHKDLIPEIQLIEMTRKEYDSTTCVSTLSASYFNGIEI